jgi:hypothetical protein
MVKMEEKDFSNKPEFAANNTNLQYSLIFVGENLGSKSNKLTQFA